jgi:hypothetical protein
MHARLEEQTCRTHHDFLGRLVSDFSRDGLYRTLLGLDARQFGDGPALCAVGQEFRNAGHGRRRCGSRNFIFVNHVPGSTKNAPFAFPACHAHDWLLFRIQNEGKFYFKNLHHFFGPGTWIHDGLNQVVPSLGDFLYRIECSHWNDFLMGPAIVSVLFPLAIVRIYKALSDRGPIDLSAPHLDMSTDLDQALRFARILLNIGLSWFFWQSWAEKAGYVSNPHSSDEIDLPFEFGGTMLGFWTARVLTKPFDERPEKFKSTFFIDFLSSGVIGLLYTLIVGPLIEGVASAVGHSLYPVVPHSLDVHKYTPFQRHMRPLELLLVAGATWWSPNRSSKAEDMTRLSGTYEGLEADSNWNVPKTMTKVMGMMTGYLVILALMFSLLEPEGLSWMLATAGTGLAAGTVAFLLVKRAGRNGITRLLRKNEIRPSGRQ